MAEAQQQRLASLRAAREARVAAAMAESRRAMDWPHYDHYSRAISGFYSIHNNNPAFLAPFAPPPPPPPLRAARDGDDPTTGSSSVTEETPARGARPPVPGADGAFTFEYSGKRARVEVVEESDGPPRRTTQVGARAAARNGGCRKGDEGAAPPPPEPEEIFRALTEVPDLVRADLLRAYSSLVRDRDGRQFRALVALPMDMRKEWLLMEIGNGKSQ